MVTLEQQLNQADVAEEVELLIKDSQHKGYLSIKDKTTRPKYYILYLYILTSKQRIPLYKHCPLLGGSTV